MNFNKDVFPSLSCDAILIFFGDAMQHNLAFVFKSASSHLKINLVLIV